VSGVLAYDIPLPPNPIGSFIDGVKGAFTAGADAVGQAALNAILHWLADSLSSACSTVMGELFKFLDSSSSVTLTQGWWAGPRAQHVLGSVGQIAGVLMVAFLLAVVIQGALAGEPGLMIRTAVKEVPLAVFGTVALVTIASLLLGLTDAASTMVLGDAPDNLGHFLSGFGVSSNVLNGGLLGVIFFLLFLVGALLVWIELIVRSSLIYLLIAAAPLTLAARVWPATRSAFRRLCEIGLALILSKFVIALALALGAAALAGGGPQDGTVGTAAGLDAAGLLSGATLMLLAAFTPFVLLRILPILETAVVAQGISHSPARAVNTAAQAGFYAQSLGIGGRGAAPTPLAAAGSGASGVGSAGAASGAAAGAGPVAAAAAPVALAKGAQRLASGVASTAARNPNDTSDDKRSS
jgi:hypothetical protein